MLLGIEVAVIVMLASAVAFAAGKRLRPTTPAVTAPEPAPLIVPAHVTSDEVQLLRPNPGSVEGLEIRYGSDALVRAVRVGAMNCEHKELLLTMDEVQWKSLPNSQKQEVLAAARSTWAAKMCAVGPDIAYVVVKTERGEIVGRADPHSVTVL